MQLNTALAAFVEGTNFQVQLNPAAAGNTVAASTNLRLWTMDFEITQDFSLGGASLTAGAGIRYANTRSTLTANQFDAGGTLRESYTVRQQFDGLGPTISAEARMPFAGLTALASLRSSMLLAVADRKVTVDADVALENGDNSFVGNSTDGLSITEIFLGVEKGWETRYANVSLRGGFESQYWANVGLATRVDETFRDGSSLWLNGVVLGMRIER